MKEFEEIDVFMPGEESKGHMKQVYNAFLQMILDLAEKIKNNEDDFGRSLMDYFDTSIELTKNYGITAYYNEDEEILYIALLWIYRDENGEAKNRPLVFINVTADQKEGYTADEAAYILMVAYINHLGHMIDSEE